MTTSIVTLCVNVFLSVIKLFAGIVASSAALVADAVNSISDVFATIVVMIGIKLASKVPDKDHPYGHERLECGAAIILSVLVFATGAMIGYSGVMKSITGLRDEIAIPGTLALVAAIVTMVVKEAMYWYTRAAAKKTGSSSLMAVAWDHRSDVLSSAGSFIGVLGARLALPVLDPIASVVISLLIMRVGVGIFREAMRKMTDTSCDDDFVNRICSVVFEHDTVFSIDSIRTRMFADRIFIDMEISMDGNCTLNETHNTAQVIHDKIEARYEKVKHCMVHVNPMVVTVDKNS
jgi:cation diffusion facilitator family transporter